MANEVLLKDGSAGSADILCWMTHADLTTGDFTPTHDMSMADVSQYDAIQGVKADLGALRARQYAVMLSVTCWTTPTVGGTYDVYWSGSCSSVAGVGNDGGCTGTCISYNIGDETAHLKQLTYVGSLVLTADGSGVQQKTTTGIFSPWSRYGQPVLYNNATKATFGIADQTAMSGKNYIALIPQTDEVQ
jgi:hypothetical protein